MVKVTSVAAAVAICSTLLFLAYGGFKTGTEAPLVGTDGDTTGQIDSSIALAFGDMFENKGLNAGADSLGRPEPEEAATIGTTIQQSSPPSPIPAAGRDGTVVPTHDATWSPTSSKTADASQANGMDEVDETAEPFGRGAIMAQIAATKKLLKQAQAELTARRTTAEDLRQSLPSSSPTKIEPADRSKAKPVAFLKTHKVSVGFPSASSIPLGRQSLRSLANIHWKKVVGMFTLKMVRMANIVFVATSTRLSFVRLPL
jgi:hypothetical protein